MTSTLVYEKANSLLYRSLHPNHVLIYYYIIYSLILLTCNTYLGRPDLLFVYDADEIEKVCENNFLLLNINLLLECRLSMKDATK